ncbi:MAG: phosphoribosylformylglycinamidine synthase subunit PurQ, partial [Paramuribaculum sp.]|nr:phosphoribosylformylglycinamidine synthase subunit PurQ [Paramuribaculum sp.]
ISAGGLITTLLEMTFANTEGGLSVENDAFNTDLTYVLFAENPAAIIQVADNKKERVEKVLRKLGVRFIPVATPIETRSININHAGTQTVLDIDSLRDVWFETSYMLDTLQSGEECALQRFHNYKSQPLKYRFSKSFKGKLADYDLINGQRPRSGIKAAIIREKGINGDREMAYSLYLAGFDVKDVHMTDLISGRETLDDVNMLVFCGGFSNSDVLGSAKGWAGGFLWNKQAADTLKRFYEREDTLSLGVCNGCQLMIELGLINPEHSKPTKMCHNNSHKFESAFVNVDIPRNNSVMLSSLAGMRLGIWVAHGEGKFALPMSKKDYNIGLRYSYSGYPGNPNGSKYDVAGIYSADGRHLAMMPHLERAIFPWQWAYYPSGKNHQVSPWIEAFVNAFNWIKAKKA